MSKKPISTANYQQLNELMNAQLLAKDEIIEAQKLSIEQLEEAYDFLKSQIEVLNL